MPKTHENLFFEGNRLLQANDLAGAAACFEQACTLEPGFAQGWANLGLVWDKLRQIDQAERAYRKALELGCDAFELYLNYGALLAAQMQFGGAEWAYTQALRINPQSAALWSNLGALYVGMQQEDDARACLHRALELEPQHGSARFNLAYMHLQRGDFAKGWEYFEARQWYGAVSQSLPCPRWSGEALAGKSIVLLFEAGHGDVIQFVRYVPLLKALGASRVGLICHPALVSLVSTAEGLDQAVSYDEPLTGQDWNWWSPLLSLPYHLQTRADNLPAPRAYLQADAVKVAHWRASLVAMQQAIAPTTRAVDQFASTSVLAPVPLAQAAPTAAPQARRIGLVWKGNPNFENDSQRSIAHLRLLEPLLQLPGVLFVSLQKGAGETEPAELQAERQSQGLPPWPLINPGPQMQDFADSAAIVSQLDMVITVDTAAAHLAGALGVPCHVLLPDYMTDWRWGLVTEQSMWYPHTHRLWRQQRGGGWPEVIAGVAAGLHFQTCRGKTLG